MSKIIITLEVEIDDVNNGVLGTFKLALLTDIRKGYNNFKQGIYMCARSNGVHIKSIEVE